MKVAVLYDLLASAAQRWPAATALQLGDTSISYAELEQDAARVSRWLYEIGVRRWDRVGLYLHKRFEEVAALFAISKLGAAFVSVHHQWGGEQLDLVIRDAGLTVLFVDPITARRVANSAAITALRALVVVDGEATGIDAFAWRDLDGAPAPADQRPLDRDVAALCYTSGSTARPKGVMVSHRNFIEGTERVDSYLHHQSEDRLLGLLPVSAPWGVIQITSMFAVGGTVVLQPVAMPAEIADTLGQQRVTGMAALPPTWIQLAAYLSEAPASLPKLRYITSSGGVIPRPVLEALPRLFPSAQIYLTYGLTEAFRSTYLPPEKYREKMGSFGKPCTNVDVFVVREGEGICGPGQEGELVHRGSLVTLGYWGDPEATAASYRPCPELRPWIGEELVHYSGDIVRIDGDGYLWFVGRRDDLLKCGGFRVSPAEIEHLVYESGLVGEALACGIADPTLGQVVGLAVGGHGGGAVDSAALLRYCRVKMPPYMVPHRIIDWSGPLPRLSSGKLDRATIARRFAPTGRK